MNAKGGSKWLRIYAIFGTLMLLLLYIIPYIALRSVKGFTLYGFWSFLVLAWIIITIVFIEKRWGK